MNTECHLNCEQGAFRSDKSRDASGDRADQVISPDAMDTLAPDVLSVRDRHVHVQVADVGLLRVVLQTLCDPEGLKSPQERVADEDESLTTDNSAVLFQKKWKANNIIQHCDRKNY